MRCFSTTFNASSLCMFRTSTLPPARAARIISVTAGFCMETDLGQAGDGETDGGRGQRTGRRGGRGAEFTIRAMSDDSSGGIDGGPGFGRVRMVLVGTQHPGNIGSAA